MSATDVKRETKRCGVVRKGKPPCKYTKGWGTDHPGRGPCKFHGGAMPNNRKAAAREEAEERGREYARGAFGAKVEIDPLDAQLLSVYLARGIVDYWRAKGEREAGENGGTVSPATLDGYARAVADFNRFSKNAVDVDIAGRLLTVAERAGEQIALVCEDALAALVAAGVKLTNAQRTVYAQAVGKSVTRLEDEAPVPNVALKALTAGDGS